jgi:hypothetical protein
VSRDLEKMLSRFLDFGVASSGFGRNVWSVWEKTGVCDIAASLDTGGFINLFCGLGMGFNVVLLYVWL